MKFPHVVGASGYRDFRIDVPSIDVRCVLDLGRVFATSGRGRLIAEGQVGEKPNRFRSKAPISFLSNNAAAGRGVGRLKTAEACHGEARFS